MIMAKCRRLPRVILGALVLIGINENACGGEALVAVATNFSDTAKALAPAFKKLTGHSVKYSFGSTGKLYAQIANGAPYDVFLAADNERPFKAEMAGFAVPGTRYTYATGKLVLVKQRPLSSETRLNGEYLKLNTANIQKLAMANPTTAPYGAAAMEVLRSLKLEEEFKGKIVLGESVAQTYQFLHSGNVDLAFVSYSQVIENNSLPLWKIPDTLYTPLLQDAVLLTKGEKNEAAMAFYQFLKHPEYKKIIKKFGYE